MWGGALFVISCLFRPNAPGELKTEWIIHHVISNVSIHGCSEEGKEPGRRNCGERGEERKGEDRKGEGRKDCDMDA